MRICIALLLVGLLGACATPEVARHDDRFFHDALFAPPSERIRAADVFALSDEMRQYVDSDIAQRVKRGKTRQLALFDALASRDGLKLEYDSGMTRTGAQAFADRAGNCLSLVIMTSALAKALDLTVTYQKVFIEDIWARSGDMYLVIGHVNLTLGRWKSDDRSAGYRVGQKPREADAMTIDFLPPEDMRNVKSFPIGEDIVIAMYMNNRAVESLARGRQDDAYWWAREAMVQSPRFLSAYNTLGAVYRKHGNLAESESVLRFVLAREPDNTQAMANLVAVLAESGKRDESDRLAARLAKLEPVSPLAYYERGMEAMRAGDLRAAKEAFLLELARSPDYHELHFWLAVVHVRLGEHEGARKHLALAIKYSPSRRDKDIYAAKLDKLNAVH
jgi:tetratricopeptide (TPR) repeat protein